MATAMASTEEGMLCFSWDENGLMVCVTPQSMRPVFYMGTVREWESDHLHRLHLKPPMVSRRVRDSGAYWSF